MRELKTRSFRDRKVLWHRIDQELKKKSNPEDLESEKPVIEKFNSTHVEEQQQQTNEQTVEVDSSFDNINDNETNISDTDDTTSDSTTNKWKNSRIKVDKSNDWLFQFDDEEFSRQNPDDDDDNSLNDFDSDIDLHAADAFDEENDYRPSDFHMAASLPVTIPNLLARNIQPQKKVANSPPVEKPGSTRRPFIVRFFLFIFFISFVNYFILEYI